MKLITCGECGGDVEMVAKPGRTRDYGKGRILPIPADFELPTCVQCDEEYMDIETSSRLDAILDPDNWSIDRATADLVEARLDICVNRVIIDRAVAESLGLPPNPSDNPSEAIWVFGAGPFMQTKTFGHGRTVEDAHAAFRAKVFYQHQLQPMRSNRPRSQSPRGDQSKES